jgi:hypothetical protein
VPSRRLCHKDPSLVLSQATRVASAENSVRPALAISARKGAKRRDFASKRLSWLRPCVPTTKI